jgi:small subunit ribosomal protein S15
MARMYSRKRGKSGSHRPAEKKAPWVKYKPEEIAEIVVKLAKTGNSSAEIGTILRDQYGVPLSRVVGEKKISKILKEHNLAPVLPEDILNLIKKAVKLRTHLSRNKHDRYSKRGLELTESKIRRLSRYYINSRVLPNTWKYDHEKAKLLVK